MTKTMRVRKTTLVVLLLAVLCWSGMVALGCKTSSGGIATVESISASAINLTYTYTLDVDLKPGGEAKANTVYTVDLYERVI